MSLLGPAPESAKGSVMTVRDPADHFLARGGAALRELRHLLLPALHAVNDRVGWISRGAINYIAQRLDVAPAEIYGVASFYALFSLDERPRRQVHVCVDLACRAAGGLAEHDLPPGTHPSPCLGACERAPAALAIEAGDPQRRALFAPATRGRGAPHRRRCVARRRGCP